MQVTNATWLKKARWPDVYKVAWHVQRNLTKLRWREKFLGNLWLFLCVVLELDLTQPSKKIKKKKVLLFKLMISERGAVP